MTNATQCQPAEMLASFEAKMKAHDWFYQYSDDHSVYQRGEAQLDELLGMRRALERDGLGAEANALWAAHSRSAT